MNIREIADLLYKASGANQKTNTKIYDATVVSVDEAKRTCIVDSEDSNIDGIEVRLTSSISDGEINIPTVGETVTVAEMNGTMIVIGISWIDKKTIIVGDQLIQIEDGKITFNSDEYGGLARVPELVKKFNVLEDEFNSFKDLFKQALSTVANEPGNGAPSAFQAALALKFAKFNASILNKTQQSDIENASIVHGKNNE